MAESSSSTTCARSIGSYIDAERRTFRRCGTYRDARALDRAATVKIREDLMIIASSSRSIRASLSAAGGRRSRRSRPNSAGATMIAAAVVQRAARLRPGHAPPPPPYPLFSGVASSMAKAREPRLAMIVAEELGANSAMREVEHASANWSRPATMSYQPNGRWSRSGCVLRACNWSRRALPPRAAHRRGRRDTGVWKLATRRRERVVLARHEVGVLGTFSGEPAQTPSRARHGAVIRDAGPVRSL